MHDRCVVHGLAAPLVHTRSTADVACAAYAEAQVLARALCRDLGDVLARLAPGATGAGWSAHRIFHLLWTVLGYRRIWADVLGQHAHAHWHVMLPQQAHTYGVHSFIPGLMLINTLRERSVPHTAYTFDCPGLDAYQLPDLRRLPPELDLIAHLPTCKYDAPHIADELRASGLRAAALTSQLYDAPLDGIPATGLVDLAVVRELLGAGACGHVEALQAPLSDVLRRHLLPWIAQPRFLELQVQALWEALEAQALLHLWLERHFAGRLPRQLLISNHDATVHGALTGFAEQHGIATFVLPHSRVHNMAIKIDGPAPRCLHHALQGSDCFDLADRLLPSGLLRFPGEWVAPPDDGALRTLGLVLNGLSANGMCLVHFDDYVDSLRLWLDWARERGLALKLRVRVAETPVLLLAERLQMDAEVLMQGMQGSLIEFATGCDLTLGLDQPTSGLQDLVRMGMAAMQVELRPLARNEWSIVDERIVPRHGGVEARERLALLQANPTLFVRYRREQFEAARARAAAARPLRDWLAA
ncbi:MAG: hypothetical protein ACK44A_16935 [Roseateles sp.]